MEQQKTDIVELIDLTGYDPVTFCSKASISLATLHRVRRRRAISKPTINRICRVLNVEPDQISGFTLTGKRAADGQQGRGEA